MLRDISWADYDPFRLHYNLLLEDIDVLEDIGNVIIKSHFEDDDDDEEDDDDYPWPYSVDDEEEDDDEDDLEYEEDDDTIITFEKEDDIYIRNSGRFILTGTDQKDIKKS